ncbi:MAG: DUF4469 domain-containing protein [Spirochaetota bacterium]
MAKISDNILEIYISPSNIGGKKSFYGHPGEVIYHNLSETMKLADFNEEEQATFIALSSRLKQAGKELTAKGQSHDNGFFQTFFSISGAFDSVDDHFKPERNDVRIHARIARDWEEAARRCKVRSSPAPQFTAQVSSAQNFTANTSWNEQHKLAVQAGQIVILHGENLKISGLNSGLELENLTTGTKTLIDRFSTNLPKELQFPFPNIAAGSYSVTLKTFYHPGTDYVEQKSAALTLEFTVT